MDQQRDTTYQTGTGEWRWLDLPLSKDTLNKLVIRALDTLGAVAADDTIRIYHYSNYIDSIDPAIWEIKVDDMLHTATPIIYTAHDSANIKVTAYDNISGIKKVRAGAGRNDSAIFNLPGINVFGCTPSFQRFTVKKLNPWVLGAACD